MQIELSFILTMLSVVVLAYYLTSSFTPPARIDLVFYVNQKTDSLEALLRLTATRFSWSSNFRLGQVQVYYLGPQHGLNQNVVERLHRKNPYITGEIVKLYAVSTNNEHRWVFDCTQQHSTWEVWENIKYCLSTAS